VAQAALPKFRHCLGRRGSMSRHRPLPRPNSATITPFS
jgi:hypothetical protein